MTCEQTVVVNDIPPVLICPDDIVVQAEFEVDYNSNVIVPPPTWSDNCPDPVLTWELTPPTGFESQYDISELTGTDPYSSPNTFYLGVTTITYTVTDAHNHVVSCDFTITVLGKPEITCPPLYETTTDPGVCTATRNSGHFGLPTLDEGVQPITWTWTIYNPDGKLSNNSYSPFIGSVSNPGPPDIPDYPFQLGESTITWRAENISGFDECSHLVIVTDNEKPTYTTAPIANRVDMLLSATYDDIESKPEFRSGSEPIKNPSPDYFTFESGNTTLNLTDLADNCCDSEDLIINWRIDFTDTPDPLNPSGTPLTHASISGTGQPSDYGSI